MKRIAVLFALLAPALVVKPAHAISSEVQYVSSHTATSDTNATVVVGRATLYKVVVSSAGTGTAFVNILNGAGTVIASVDATAQRDTTFDAYVSSGLAYTTSGTIAPQVSILYSRTPAGLINPANGVGPFNVVHSTGVYTTRSLRAGRTFLKRIVVGRPGTAPSSITVYDSNGSASGRVIDIINTENYRAVDYNVYLNTGLTYTSTGNPGVTFVYGTR